MRAAMFAAIVLATGCSAIIGIDDPTLAESVTVNGEVRENASQSGVAGLSVELVSNTDGQPIAGIAKATTDAAGQYTIAVDRDLIGTGIEAQIHVFDERGVTPPYMTVYYHPPSAIANSGSYAGLEVFTSPQLDAFAAAQGVTSASTGRTLVAYVIQDGGVTKNATVTVNATGTVKYVDEDGTLSSSLTRTSERGQAYVFNLGASAGYTASATQGGRSGSAKAVTVEEGQIGIVEVDLQ